LKPTLPVSLSLAYPQDGLDGAAAPGIGDGAVDLPGFPERP
jgi:hypothetical protein